MTRKQLWTVISLLLAASMLLTACQPAPTPITTSEPQIITQIVEGPPREIIVTPEAPAVTEEPAGPQKKVLRLHWLTGDIPSLDTALAWDVISIQIIDTATVGLTRQNEQTGEVELAMATDYEVADDGVTYTFHLRDDVPWVKYDKISDSVVQVMDCEGNPRMVTAHDFVYAIHRTANPDTAADYAYVLGMAVKGVNEYNSGEVDDPETIGARALDDYTLEITFVEPAVYNLNLAGLWFMHAMPSWLIEGDDCTNAAGGRWVETGFYQGYGPYTLKEWIHDAELTLIKNPFWPGNDVVPSPKIDEINWRFIDGTAAMNEYEVDNIDVVSFPSNQYDRVHSDPELSQQISPTFTLGTEFYAFNTQLAPTNDVRVRRALSMAIDRAALIENVTKSGTEAHWFVHPGVAGAPKPETHPDLGIQYDPEGAKALMDEYLAETGQNAADLAIVLMFNTSEGHRRNAEAIQQMWAETLGVTVTLVNQEFAVFRATRREGAEHIYRGSWVQDYPDANNFLFEVFSPGGAYQDVVNWPFDEKVGTSYNNPLYDEFVSLLEQAAVETDPVARADLYAQAEHILVVEEAVVAPLYWYSGEVLIKPWVVDTPSIIGYDRFEKWDILDH